MKLRDSRAKHPKRHNTVYVNCGMGQCPIGDSMAMAAQVMRNYERRIEAEVQTGPGTVHVKAGKPLTEHGAKLLGAVWPPVV